MTISGIRSKVITGADLTGSNADINRTYEIPVGCRKSIQEGSLKIAVNHAYMHVGTGRDYTLSERTITFINRMFDGFIISLRWVEE